ncbi:MAG TPA: hypothetical protein VN578_15210 [Candidatus Binatia bacterium]|jgi:hypothetical protein|nr:hypothetical protein [Candidatus Binatia bacterium]
MRARPSALLLLLLALAGTVRAARLAAAQTAEDTRREAAIVDFTRRMKEANYPALFDQAAREFTVPPDILKGIAFAETRWSHLTWPPGELASPDNGMPRPYGIMSLWDNPFFGHSLLDAAKLIGQDPETLKADPLQNIRGAAALLRKIYDENPKPDATTENDIESWRYAIRKYCGIPEPDLNARHALEIYTFMSQGYHQYGIEWDARPINLEPIRQETFRITADEQAKRQARIAANAQVPPPPPPQLSANPKSDAEMLSNRIVFPRPGPAPASTAAEGQPGVPSLRSTLWFIGGALAALAAMVVAARKEPRDGAG